MENLYKTATSGQHSVKSVTKQNVNLKKKKTKV